MVQPAGITAQAYSFSGPCGPLSVPGGDRSEMMFEAAGGVSPETSEELRRSIDMVKLKGKLTVNVATANDATKLRNREAQRKHREKQKVRSPGVACPLPFSLTMHFL